MNTNILYKISPHTQLIKRINNEFAVYNSLYSGSLIFLNSKTINFLNKFIEPINIQDISLECYGHVKYDILSTLVSAHIIIPENRDERKLLKKRIVKHYKNIQTGKKLKGIILEITKQCNFRCAYCFATLLSRNGNRQKNVNMSSKTAKRAVEMFLLNAKKNKIKKVEISFFGGEPLINWVILKETVNYTEKLGQEFSVDVIFSITTNGSLITQKIACFLKKHRFRISVSLDGPAEINDLNRFYVNQRGTYYDVVMGINELVKSGVEVTVLTTINDQNFEKIDSDFIDKLLTMKVANWGVNLEDMSSMLKIDIDKIANKLILLADYAIKHKLNTAGMWFKPIYTMINKKIAYCSAAEGAFLSVEPNGSIYSCSRTSVPIGHLDHFEEIFASNLYLQSSANIVGNIPYCRECVLEGLCLGGCMAVNSKTNKNCIACSLTGRNKIACKFVKKVVHEILCNSSLSFLD